MKRYLTSVVFCVLFLSNMLAQKAGTNLVSSATPEATEVGAFILNKGGGNAIDAAVAVSFTLCVTKPAMSGLCAGTMLLVSFPDKSPIALLAGIP